MIETIRLRRFLTILTISLVRVLRLQVGRRNRFLPISLEIADPDPQFKYIYGLLNRISTVLLGHSQLVATLWWSHDFRLLHLLFLIVLGWSIHILGTQLRPVREVKRLVSIEVTCEAFQIEGNLADCIRAWLKSCVYALAEGRLGEAGVRCEN